MSGAGETMWSRRRAAVKAEADAELRQAKAAIRVEKQEEFEKKSDEEILLELSLKDPDQMRAGDDFAAFMRDEVPQRLRQRALRTLWRSNPVLACVDDLVEYGEDFKAEWIPGEVVRTAYQVGKGMLAHVEEMERQKAAEAELSFEEGDDSDEIPDEPDSIVPEKVASLPETEPQPVMEPIEEDPAAKPVRRMRFEFDGVA